MKLIYKGASHWPPKSHSVGLMRFKQSRMGFLQIKSSASHSSPVFKGPQLHGWMGGWTN